MTIAFGSMGAKSAGGTTSLTIAHPAVVDAGDLLITGRCLWLDTATATQPSGWKGGPDGTSGTGTAIDSHTTRIRGDWKIAVGTEDGTNLTTAQAGTLDGALGVMLRYTKDSTKTWEVYTPIAVVTDATHGANRATSITGAVILKPGDCVVALIAVDTDTALTITNPRITFSSNPVGTTTRRTSGAGVTTGTDGNIEVFDAVYSGTEGLGYLGVDFTTATSQCGPVGFLILREVTTANAANEWTGNGEADGTDLTQANMNTPGNGAWVTARGYSGGATMLYAGDGFSVENSVGTDIARMDAVVPRTSALVARCIYTHTSRPTGAGHRFIEIRNPAGAVASVSVSTAGVMSTGFASGSQAGPTMVVGHRYKTDLLAAQNESAPTTTNGRVAVRVVDLDDPTWNSDGEYFYDSLYTINAGVTEISEVRFGKNSTGDILTPAHKYERLGWATRTVNPADTGKAALEAYFLPDTGALEFRGATATNASGVNSHTPAVPDGEVGDLLVWLQSWGVPYTGSSYPTESNRPVASGGVSASVIHHGTTVGGVDDPTETYSNTGTGKRASSVYTAIASSATGATDAVTFTHQATDANNVISGICVRIKRDQTKGLSFGYTGGVDNDKATSWSADGFTDIGAQLGDLILQTSAIVPQTLNVGVGITDWPGIVRGSLQDITTGGYGGGGTVRTNSRRLPVLGGSSTGAPNAISATTGGAGATSIFRIRQVPPVTATATLTATSTLSSDATVSTPANEQAGTATMSATSTLTSDAVRERLATVALSATSTLTSTATRETSATATLSATSTLTSNAVRERPATATMSATSTLTSNAVRERPATVALSATSTLTSNAVRERLATAALVATSTLTSTAVRERLATATMTATSTLTASAVREALAAATMTAVSTLTSDATGGGTSSAALVAVSTLSSTASRELFAAAALTATSTLTASGVRTVASVAALVATSTLTSTSVRTAVATVTLSATSILTTTAIRSTAGTAALSAVSTLTVAGIRTRLGTAALTATSTLTVTGVRTRLGTATLTATSTLTVTGARATSGAVAMTITSTLTSAETVVARVVTLFVHDGAGGLLPITVKGLHNGFGDFTSVLLRDII